MTSNDSSRDDAALILDVWLGSQLTGRPLDDDLRPLGLTGDEFGLYSLIHSTGPATPAQISRWTGMAQSTVSDMLWRITARGHLDDIPNPDDARSPLIRLSDEGLSVAVQAAKALAKKQPSNVVGHPCEVATARTAAATAGATLVSKTLGTM